jgi:phosphoribosylamine--glycine ligase
MCGMSAKFLFVSTYGASLDLAWQCKREGAEVRLHIRSKPDRDVGDGFVEKADDWQAHKDWADVIVFDDVGFGPVCEKLRAEGKAVIGGTSYTDRLEFDRDFGQQEMKAAGMTILPCWDFEGSDAFERAMAFIREHPDRYVVKPNGKAQSEKVLSFVGQEDDGRDVIETLAFFKRGWGAKIQGFQIQKFAAGVEVAIGAFFNGKDFVLPAIVNFEHKKLFPGDIGPSTGEMGTSSFWCGEIPLVKETILRFRERLAACHYVGYFDLNCIANHRGIVPLEATCRFGYPTLNLQMEGMLSKWTELLPALARGEPFHLRTKRGFQIAVVVAVPPFPFEDPAAFKKYSEDAAVIFKRPLTEGLHPCDVKLVENDWRLAGCSGYALVVTGSANTMLDARKEAYNRVKQVMIPNMFYRTDIGERWMRDGDLLQSWGFLG